MALCRTVFAQLMDFVPDRTFRRIVARHKGNHRIYNFSCWDQFLAMAFAQLTYRDGLRDIHACLSSLGPALYHSGTRSDAPKSTLADANEHRPWEIYRDLAMALIARALVYCITMNDSYRKSTPRSIPWMQQPSSCASNCSHGQKLRTIWRMRTNFS